MPVASERELAPILSQYAKPGDLVICLGAGTITDWAHALPEWLNASQPVYAEPRRGTGT